MNHKRWNLYDAISVEHPLIKTGLPPLVAQLLSNRGLNDPDAADSFLKIDNSLSHDPFILQGMAPAVNRIFRALLSGEKVAIYGDFDADGVTATVLLIFGLSELGVDVVPYLPHRMNEGHGLKVAALEQLHAEGVKLIITVDCGITGAAAVKKANRLGMDVIITDHHVPLSELPPAYAIINPKLPDSVYPFKELAGVGVAYKLLQGVYQGLNRSSNIETVLDLVAVGTIADMTPLVGENRYLVDRGLQSMNTGLRPGLKELLAKAGFRDSKLSANNITWMVAPRINTASRMDTALPSYELMMTQSVSRAQELAAWLEQKNVERQQITQQAVTHARNQISNTGVRPVLIVDSGDFPAGINGLVAGRLADEYYRPAVVLKQGKRVSTGSCRSIPEFNIVEALAGCGDIFQEFGGHSQAAGFTLPSQNLPILQEKLLQLATGQLAGLDLRPRIDVDTEVVFKHLDEQAYTGIQRLEPYGQENPAPVFLSRKVQVVNCRTMGSSAEHLKLRLQQGDTVFDAVAFGAGDNLKEITRAIDIVFNLEIDKWNGKSSLRLNILDFMKASS